MSLVRHSICSLSLLSHTSSSHSSTCFQPSRGKREKEFQVPSWPERLASRGALTRLAHQIYWEGSSSFRGISAGIRIPCTDFSGTPLELCGSRGKRQTCPSCHLDVWQCSVSCPVPVLPEGQEQSKHRASQSLPVCTMETLFRSCHTGQYASARMSTPHDTPCCTCITDYLA